MPKRLKKLVILGKQAPAELQEPLQESNSQTALGQPLSIAEAARLIGCCQWTVRHQLLPQGLPHFRSTPGGKLIFYSAQIVAWILQKQQKGGTSR